MKIGLVRRGYSSTGGAEAYLRRLAKGLMAMDHVPVLIASHEWPEGDWPGEYVVRADGGSPMRFAHDVERAAARCDVVFSLERIFHCDVYRAGDGVHGAWLERRAKFEAPWRRWARALNRKHRELLRLEACVLSPERTRLVIANSRMVRDEIVERYGFPAGRIEIVPNGYDAPPVPEGLRERRRDELGISPGAFVALFAGSGWERKGLRHAIEAVRGLPEVTLLVAGRGDARGLDAANVRFVGARADLQPDFAAADVFVLPTIYDPFSNACLEALAAGLPVITTRANGFAEILTEGAHGTTVAPGDVGALRAALRDWMDGARRSEARAACRELAARYSVAENTTRTLAAITRAAAREEPPPCR
ncbi:MAG: glycosyltransferase family 4 protein [Terrimicrobiaceae bacterium]|nr:glycosyltransferase family 4 protein [Terrimicrobiaceae bacterium]